MKKKLLVLYFVLCMLFLFGCSSSQKVENVTLHGDVTFGMTKDEVIAKEKETGFDLSEEEPFRINASYVLRGEGTIAGVDSSHVTYMFNSDGKLFASCYDFGYASKNSLDDYEPIEQLLVSKYGKQDSTLFSFIERTGHEPIKYALRLYQTDFFTPAKCSAWKKKQDDGSYAVITHFVFEADFLGKLMTYHYVGYQKYTENELNAGADKIDKDKNDL